MAITEIIVETSLLAPRPCIPLLGLEGPQARELSDVPLAVFTAVVCEDVIVTLTVFWSVVAKPELGISNQPLVEFVLKLDKL